MCALCGSERHVGVPLPHADRAIGNVEPSPASTEGADEFKDGSNTIEHT
jgi:hypothetical protein